MPRDYWTQVIDIDLLNSKIRKASRGTEAIEKAAKILSEAKFPVILSGAGVVIEVPLMIV